MNLGGVFVSLSGILQIVLLCLTEPYDGAVKGTTDLITFNTSTHKRALKTVTVYRDPVECTRPYTKQRTIDENRNTNGIRDSWLFWNDSQDDYFPARNHNTWWYQNDDQPWHGT